MIMLLPKVWKATNANAWEAAKEDDEKRDPETYAGDD